MKMYEIIFDAGNDGVYKHFGIYQNEKAAREATMGNGDVVRVKDVTKEFPLSREKIYSALINGNFDQIEPNIISSFLARVYENATL